MDWNEKYALTEAITKAIMRGEDEYKYSSECFKILGVSGEKITIISLPLGQRTGTNHQQETYARMKAQEVVEVFCGRPISQKPSSDDRDYVDYA